MPKQNRVTPFSQLIALTDHGKLMGNRGCLHDEKQQIKRKYVGKRWIICQLKWGDTKRKLMTPSAYTALFFLYEATALATGHRPCAYCQRARFNEFRAYWTKGNPEKCDGALATASSIDNALHAERTSDCAKCPDRGVLDALPSGVFVAAGEQAFIWRNQQLQAWIPSGYHDLEGQMPSFPLQILTTPSVIRTLAAGYNPFEKLDKFI